MATSALPYANGDIHIGHLVEYLQTDFWTRFQKMRGHKCLYICADDTHGTPIMIRARQENIPPEELIARSQQEHVRDFTDFEVEFDNYSSTNSPLNRDFSNTLFKAMENNGHIIIRSVDQYYCEHDKMFLPDRFVKGTCPQCKADNQYGDSCDVCGAAYSSSEVVNPKCSTCGAIPIVKASEHLFFKLNDFKDFLKAWIPKHTPRDTANKLLEWFNEDLRDWNISRDAPYFGFEIPGHKEKFFYVWLDAPVGYMASTKEWCIKNNSSFEDMWNSKESEIYHFIGKDIVRFHCLFWPANLHNGGFKTPDQVFVHGFLTVNGEKMSKSKGTFIKARTYLDHLDPMYLRFYYATKLNSSADDLDLNFDDFISRVNSDLVGKITNLASRGAQMLNKNLNGEIGSLDIDGKQLVQAAQSKSETIANYFEAREFSKGLVEIRELADQANRYFDEKAPWLSIKTNPESTRPVLSATLNLFRLIAIYLKPILPQYVSNVEKLFGEQPYTWEHSQTILENCRISTYEYLASRIEQKQIESVIEATRKDLANDEKIKAGPNPV